MSRLDRRHESTPRYGVNQHCRGRGAHRISGAPLEFRGVDVSLHGFGVVLVGHVQPRDTIILEIGDASLTFEVMWVESHLGIDNTYRAGLQCLDRMLDVRGRLTNMGFVTMPLEDGFVA